MTLQQVIRTIERVAAGQPAVSTIVRNDIFRLNASPVVRYGAFAWLQGEHRAAPGSLMDYAFTFFYADRLTADKANEIEVQSVGGEVLTNIVRQLEDLGVWATGDVVFRTFNQRFSDECAGVYCTVTLEVPKEGLCSDAYEFLRNEADYNLDFNKDFQCWIWRTEEREIYII